MQINITDTADNWRRWGELVRSWIFGTAPLPGDVGELQTQMAGAGVQGSAPGPSTRGVTFIPYNPVAPLMISLPTQQMVLDDEAALTAPPDPAPYPLPAFYDNIYGKGGKNYLSSADRLALGRSRLGEYTIQECM